jgi:hypothetical protein
MSIMGIKGRGSVLRSVSQTIGLDGDQVVPDDAALEKKQQAQEEQAQIKAINEQVDKGIQAGVEQGVKKISSELTSGFLASKARMPGEEDTGPPGPNEQPPMGGMEQMARQAQGMQATPSAGGMIKPMALVGNQPRPLGPGARPRPPGAGPE